jgi:nitric oxide reductase subunit B
MSKKTAFWVFLIGTVSSAIVFLGLTWDTHHQIAALSTVSHGHLAFFGAYALLNIMVFYYAMPKIKGIDIYDPSRGKIAFWTMATAMMMMGLTFGIAGVVQSYLERVVGIGYMATQSYMRLWMGVTFFLGLCFFTGVLILVTDLLTLRPARKPS